MTTVVYRDGVLASDSRVTEGSMISPGCVPKVRRLPDGNLIGWCGELSKASSLIDYLTDPDNAEPFTSKKGLTAFILTNKGKILQYEGSDWFEFKQPYIALGSGKDYAYGALAMGASAKEAVKAAIKFDTGSGGRIKTLTWDWYFGK